MNDNVSEIGRSSELLKSARELLGPLAGGVRLNYPKKTEIFVQSQEADAVYLVERGIVKLGRLASNGQCVALTLCCEGELAGEEAFLPNQTYDGSAETVTGVTLLRLPSARLREVARTTPDLSMLVLTVLLQRKRTLEHRTELIAGADVERRILFYLSELAQKGVFEVASGTYSLPLTQLDVAHLIGATRETTSAALNRMERLGLLQLSRGMLTIPSPSRLWEEVLRVNASAA